MRIPPAAATGLAAAADAACVLTFAAVGRSSHAETGDVLGTLHVAWPFLTAGGLAWVVARAWRAPRRIWREGATIWALTWAGGMALRGITGGGFAPSFLVVAASALGALLLGWRAIAALLSGAPARRR